jgi:hypothetical protein
MTNNMDIIPTEVAIARVFARKTNYCPTDVHAYFDKPGRDTPQYEEVHISCTFTWDKPRALELRQAWLSHGQNVVIGGPAYQSPATDFIPGLYVHDKVTFTTRGCPRKCPRCFVPELEGDLSELPHIHPGNIIQDNNIFAASWPHWNKVMDMLATQKGICFKGGLDARLFKSKHVADLAKIQHHIAEVFTACDHPGLLGSTVEFIKALRYAGFPQWKIRCYMIIGEDIVEEEARLRVLFHAGCHPFPQLYKADPPIEYDKTWRKFQNVWCRPARTKAHLGIKSPPRKKKARVVPSPPPAEDKTV